MKNQEKNRFFSMAKTYDKVCQKMVPKYDFLQNSVIELIPFSKYDNFLFADLGAGSGIFIEKILKNFPNSKALWIDFSDDFKLIAQNKLKKFKNRVIYVKSSLEKNWDKKIGRKLDIIVSMSAIHHLEETEKKKLYSKCYQVLNKGGLFFNIDEMITIYPESYVKNMLFWVNHVEKNKTKKNLFDNDFIKHFSNWKIRNIDNIDKQKKTGDDLHSPFLNQLDYLKKSNFRNVDIYVKYHLWSVIGGEK